MMLTKPGDVGRPSAVHRQILLPLHAANALLQRLSKQPLMLLGLEYTQYLVLLTLWEQDAQTSAALRARLDLGSEELSSVIGAPTKAGLVHHKPECEENGAGAALTASGHELRKEVDQSLNFLGGNFQAEAILAIQNSVADLIAALARLDGEAARFD